MNQTIALIIPTAGMLLVFGIVYLRVTSDHRKQMAMIEGGMNPSKYERNKHSKIRTALLLLLVPSGILVGNILAPFFQNLSTSESGILFGFLFGGIALLTAYFLERIFEPVPEED